MVAASNLNYICKVSLFKIIPFQLIFVPLPIVRNEAECGTNWKVYATRETLYIRNGITHLLNLSKVDGLNPPNQR